LVEVALYGILISSVRIARERSISDPPIQGTGDVRDVFPSRVIFVLDANVLPKSFREALRTSEWPSFGLL
jgi:hypothetical protein